jgi:hypothetical protein
MDHNGSRVLRERPAISVSRLSLRKIEVEAETESGERELGR